MRFDRDQVRDAADISRIIGAHVKLRREGKELVGLCPFHKESTPSLTVSNGLYKCFGCEAGGDVFDFIGRLENISGFPAQLKRVAELAGVPPSQDEPRAAERSPAVQPRMVATYPYVDETGSLLYEVCRFEPGANGKSKGFSQRRPDGTGGWIHTKGPRDVLYRLPQVIAANTIAFTEGEKDVHTLERLGWIATTKSGGVNGKMPADAVDTLRGKTVVLIGDNDEVGTKYMASVARMLAPVATVRIIRIPAEFKDVSDYIQSGFPDLSALTPALYGEPADCEARREVTIAQKDDWPKPLGEAAFIGLAGEVVRAILPHTEADAAALMLQFLVAFGNAAGRNAFFRVGASYHHLNLFAVLAGRSAKARKGTSWDAIADLFKRASPQWATDCVRQGLASGEGLIWAVRDPITGVNLVREKGRVVEEQAITVDPGVEEKRLLSMESEFASVLRIAERDGNTLSALIRQAWDSGNLRTMTKNSPAKATGAHISIVGHVTKDELLRYLTTTESANGFANRFLWAAVKRSKELPDGGELHTVDFARIDAHLTRALQVSQATGEMKRSEEANALWRKVYSSLSGDRPGMLGSVCARAEPQVLRLSCIYALFDLSPKIESRHLAAALEVWRYCEDSARFIFGDSLGDKTADSILRALRDEPLGLTREQITVNVFGKNKHRDEIARALAVLQGLQLVTLQTENTGGRPLERWFVTGESASDTLPEKAG